MNELANTLIDNSAQCWTCPVFDTLFTIVSHTAAAAYSRLCIFSIVIFCVLLAFYSLNIVWQNIKNGAKESLFEKNIRPVLIKSLLALSLLSAGLVVPRVISTITFEPVAVMTLQFSRTMLPEDYVVPEYEDAIQLGNNSFFNPKLRDTIMQILETSVANFQVYIKVGLAVMNAAFTIKALFGIISLIKHIIIFFIGLFLTYKFAKLFINYTFPFMDVIFAMAMFAFFFPLSVVLFIFRDAKDLPGWMKNLGSNLGGGQIKKLINAIVSVSSAILTYTIIMLIIKGFLDTKGVDATSIQNSAQHLYEFDLENSSAMQITFAGAIVLVYVIEYIETKIPQITEKILSTFNIKQENALSKEMGENVFKLTEIVADKAKGLAKTIINPESAATEKKAEPKEELKEPKDK